MSTAGTARRTRSVIARTLSASVMVREMSLGGPTTLATRLGSAPEVAAVVLTIVALAGALVLRRRRRTIGTLGDEKDEKAGAR